MYDVPVALCLLSCNGVDVENQCYLYHLDAEDIVSVMCGVKVEKKTIACKWERIWG